MYFSARLIIFFDFSNSPPSPTQARIAQLTRRQGHQLQRHLMVFTDFRDSAWCRIPEKKTLSMPFRMLRSDALCTGISSMYRDLKYVQAILHTRFILLKNNAIICKMNQLYA